MRRLAIECSGDLRSIALARAGEVVAVRGETGHRSHAERLVPLIAAVVAEGGWSFADIDEVVVAAGPGSFTGIRIAVATARALALAVDRPVRSVSTLEALLTVDGANLAAIDARRGGVYAAASSATGVQLPAQALSPEDVARRMKEPPAAVGTGAALVLAASGAGRLVPGRLDAAAVLRATVAAPAALRPATPGTAVRPFYWRAPDVSASAA